MVAGIGTRVSPISCTGCSSMHTTGAVGIVGFFVRLQHLLHVGDELAVRVGRDHPVLDFPLGHAIFFSV